MEHHAFLSLHLEVAFPLKASNLPTVCGWVEGLSHSQKTHMLKKNFFNFKFGLK